MLMRLAAGLLAAASTAYAAHNTTVLVNATTIAYSGWTPFTNCGGTKYTFDLGGFFNFNFVGTGVYVVGTASLEGGIITFNVDGTTTTFDRYSPPPYKCGVLLFGKGGLTNTSHSLTATLSGPSPANATQSAFFEFQYLQYTQLDIGDTLSSSSDLPASGTATATGTASGAPQQPSSGGGVNAGAIGGGIAAGVIGLGIIGFVIWFCVRREKQEKAAAAAAVPRLEIDRDPPRQSFIYSPVGASVYGRLSHDGEAGGDRRRSMSTTAGPWIPDAHVAANLAPQSNSSVTHYPPGAPSVVQSSSSGSPPRTYASGFPPSSSAPGGKLGMMGASALPESEVERIAARVASMMHPPPPPPPPGAQAGRPPKGGAPPPMQQATQEAYDDLPPPMYEPRQNP